MAEVRLEAICKRFEEFLAVDRFNLAIKDRVFERDGPADQDAVPIDALPCDAVEALGNIDSFYFDLSI